MPVDQVANGRGKDDVAEQVLLDAAQDVLVVLAIGDARGSSES
jgi:hypothetical protein